MRTLPEQARTGCKLPFAGLSLHIIAEASSTLKVTNAIKYLCKGLHSLHGEETTSTEMRGDVSRHLVDICP